MKIKKISFILIISIVLILTGCVQSLDCGCADCQIKSGEDIKIFIAADPHHMSKKLYDNGKTFENFINTGDGKLLDYSGEIIDEFISDVEKNDPDIVIIPGDLTANGEKASHLEFSKKLNAIKETCTCVFVIPGNHDIENPWSREFTGENINPIDSITEKEFVDIYGSYGYDDALSRDENSLSYLVTPSEDIWLLMIDSAKYKNNQAYNYPEVGGGLSSKTLEWIKQCANEADENDAQIIAVLHHSLLDHSKIINTNYTIDNNRRILKVLQDSNIEIALTGHTHLQDIKSYEKDNNTIYDISTSCLISYPNQYGVLEFSPDSGYEYSTETLEISENPVAFKNHSQDFFESRDYNKYYNSLLKIDNYSRDEIEAMAETIALLNSRYFAGFRNEDLEDLKDTKGFKLLEQSEPNHIRDYIMSMFSDEKRDNNHLLIPINSVK